MLQTATSLNAFSTIAPDDTADDLYVRRPARPHVLLASLGVAAATLVMSGASMLYAFTHIPEVDPNAEAAPVAEVAAIAAEAPAVPAKLDVLPPPIYTGVTSEAPAMGFIPLSAHAHMDTAQMDTTKIDAVDPYKLAQADGETQPCADPCSAQAGYVVEPTDSAEARPVHATAANVTETDDDDDGDGNAPPPPGVTVN